MASEIIVAQERAVQLVDCPACNQKAGTECGNTYPGLPRAAHAQRVDALVDHLLEVIAILEDGDADERCAATTTSLSVHPECVHWCEYPAGHEGPHHCGDHRCAGDGGRFGGYS